MRLLSCAFQTHFLPTVVLMIFLLSCYCARSISAIETDMLGEYSGQCPGLVNDKPCNVDGYVGSDVLYEDEYVRVWNFTLAPGESTSMHRHDYDYHFVAIHPTQLEVYGENGSRLFDFRAEGVLGFKINGQYLEPIGGLELPWPVPRIHSAKNIGDSYYYEILFETKRNDDSSKNKRTAMDMMIAPFKHMFAKHSDDEL
uniref:Cupin 2 conserved barrel domain-containing protein n=1 Tax=Ditylum brightwellii TaxID=49249 RepID=A0A7S4QK43_9STRA|mmetsp:Transcript_10522/g.14102  ORF Transcript_10522/g.14102 Transcript_10522/m.14102 type:complete len:199 (-) Transcript_10522:126-722(-)